MRVLLFGVAVGVLILSGCSREVASAEAPPQVEAEAPVGDVRIGDRYAVVIEKMGSPNIDSECTSSRVLIYDELEIKLEQDVVVEIFDHR